VRMYVCSVCECACACVRAYIRVCVHVCMCTHLSKDKKRYKNLLYMVKHSDPTSTSISYTCSGKQRMVTCHLCNHTIQIL